MPATQNFITGHQTGGGRSLFFDVDIFEQIAAKGIDAEVFDFLADRLLDNLMSNGQPGSLFLNTTCACS